MMGKGPTSWGPALNTESQVRGGEPNLSANLVVRSWSMAFVGLTFIVHSRSDKLSSKPNDSVAPGHEQMEPEPPLPGWERGEVGNHCLCRLAGWRQLKQRRLLLCQPIWWLSRHNQVLPRIKAVSGTLSNMKGDIFMVVANNNKDGWDSVKCIGMVW